MSAVNGGRVPFTFPISVKQGETERYRQELDDSGIIERITVFFPKGSRTDIRLTLKAGGDSLNEAEATDDSPEIPDYIIGSATTYDFDTEIEVYDGQEIGVDAENVSGSSDLDAFVAFSVDYTEGVSR